VTLDLSQTFRVTESKVEVAAGQNDGEN